MNKTELRKTMRANLKSSFSGWVCWHNIAKKYGLDKTTIILLPSNNSDEVNYFSLLYLDKLTRARKNKRSLVITTDPIIERAAALLSKTFDCAIIISEKEMDQMLQLYSLFPFSKRLVVAALGGIEGRKADMIVGRNKTTVEELVAVGVYALKPSFEKLKRPRYDQEDFEISNELRLFSLVSGQKYN